jgi:hypothetical protein
MSVIWDPTLLIFEAYIFLFEIIPMFGGVMICFIMYISWLIMLLTCSSMSTLLAVSTYLCVDGKKKACMGRKKHIENEEAKLHRSH